jgi:toxin ParE1/3/4
MQYVVSRLAERDLDDIWDYTAERWSTDQAEDYVGRMRTAVEILAADPARGRPCDDIRQGYRKYRVGSHMIFYRIRGGRIVIVRILHQRMDFQRHL